MEYSKRHLSLNVEAMDLVAFHAAIGALPYGKCLPTAIYVLDVDPSHLPTALLVICRELRRRLEIGAEYNILKFHTDRPKISFLSYPDFLTEPHPSLNAYVLVDLVTGKVRRDDYRARINPPILHRKEQFLPPDHPSRKQFEALTKAEEAAGLLDETDRIGFRLNWEKILAERAVKLRGHKLVKITAPAVDLEVKAIVSPHLKVDRHRTALTRTEASKPIKLLMELGQLRRGESVFDYGCGLGADVTALRGLGHAASGWDPVHAPAAARQSATIVNLGYVLNVIEDPAERIEVLNNAWRLAERLLVVSTLVRGQEGYSDFRCCGDGLMTSRNTFQKYFEPAELQAMIEDTLGCESVAVAMGIHFVFRRVDELQDFLSQRSHRVIDWMALSHRLGLRKALRSNRDPYDTHRELLDDFWTASLGLGRVPREEEFERLAEVRSACGSVPRAFQLFFDKFGRETFDAARVRRQEDLLVFLAAGILRKKVPFNGLSLRLQRDIRSFFGDYMAAQAKAKDLMFAAGDKDEIDLALQGLKFGWLDRTENHFTVHRSLLDELPAIFRVYIECGARLFGNPREADLIKIHLYSGKLTFQHYDDFDGAMLPQLKLRIKIDLRRLFVTVFDHTTGPEHQLLFFKERFVPSGYAFGNDAAGFSKRLKKLGFSEDTIGYGPSLSQYEELCISRKLTPGLYPRK